MTRIVSLIASSTEIICAMGFEKQMVGRSHECDYPPSITHLPVVTEVKFPTQASSREIDNQVKRIVREGLSVYRVKPEMLRQLKPDVVVTQIHCEVCAVSKKDVEKALCTFLNQRQGRVEGATQAPLIVSLEPNALNDVWEDIRRVAQALDAPQKGEELIVRLQSRMDKISRKAATIFNKPTVACIEWIDPLMACGNWMPELVELAGGVNLLGHAGRHSPRMTFEDLVVKNPDIIIVAPCGFDIPRTLQEMPLLASHTGWSQLKAVKNNKVFVADGNQYFNRPGPRLVESLEILAEILHPAHFSFGHQNTGYHTI